ncbi:hypothetical protein [Bacillus sp. OTU530]
MKLVTDGVIARIGMYLFWLLLKGKSILAAALMAGTTTQFPNQF